MEKIKKPRVTEAEVEACSEFKTCSVCKESKKVVFFDKRKGGFKSACKECNKAKYYTTPKATSEAVKEAVKTYENMQNAPKCNDKDGVINEIKSKNGEMLLSIALFFFIVGVVGFVLTQMGGIDMYVNSWNEMLKGIGLKHG